MKLASLTYKLAFTICSLSFLRLWFSISSLGENKQARKWQDFRLNKRMLKGNSLVTEWLRIHLVRSAATAMWQHATRLQLLSAKTEKLVEGSLGWPLNGVRAGVASFLPDLRGPGYFVTLLLSFQHMAGNAFWKPNLGGLVSPRIFQGTKQASEEKGLAYFSVILQGRGND